MPQKPSLIIIVGPTCVGKTEVAITLAEPLGGQIISADAVQVYRLMDIGTAKPTEEERAHVPHHLIDVIYPDESFSAARFRAMADEVIRDLHVKGRPIFVVGGTGLYIKALTQGLFRVRKENGAIRARLKIEAKSLGLHTLFRRLERVDPAAAMRIHPNDSYRIMRALEIFELTKTPLSEQQRAHAFSENPYHVLKIGLFMDREILYSRINERVERMLALGLLDEVEGLLSQGFSPNLKAMKSIGYRHMVEYLEGKLVWSEAVRLFKRDTRRYAKRQLTWFRADPEVYWFHPKEVHAMRGRINAFLTGEAPSP